MRVFLHRVRSLFSRARLDDELREEIEGHIEQRRQALIDEGVDPAAAAAEARRMFGNATVLRERTREMWSVPILDSIAQDIRYGARQLRSAPVFTSVAVLSMAAGLTAALAIFTFMNAAVLRPLGVGDGERIHRVYTQSDSGQLYGASAYADYLAFAGTPGLFETTCATARIRTATLETDMRPQVLSGELVSPDCFAGATAMQSAFTGLAALRPLAALPIVILYFAVAAFAAWWAARRAGCADPAALLRCG